MSTGLGKYKLYPEYKNSDIEWLDLMPKNWVKIRLDSIATYIRDSKSANWLNGKTVMHYSIPAVQEYGSGLIEDGTELDSNKLIVKAGDLLISKLNPRKGTLTIVNVFDGDIVASTEFIALRTHRINTLYLFYLFQSQQLSNFVCSQVESATRSHQRVNPTVIYKLNTCMPSDEEKQKIIHFLDYETTRIDCLIAKQQQLIELLKEKRQAVISHVVTKGLNPDVPMKDSGVEWLGQVPEHWDVKPLRYLGSCQNGINISADAFGTGYPFVSYGDVYNNRELPTKPKGLVESSISDRVSYSVKSGDVLFTRTSETIEEIGFTSVCIHEIKDACFAGFIIRFRPSKETLYPYFSKYYFSNNLLRYFFVKEMNLVTRASLSQDLLKKLTVAIPPYDEQVEIADYLNLKNQFFDIAEQSCCKQINLLKERRISLISSAVTGKIDLRNWAPPLMPSDEVA